MAGRRVSKKALTEKERFKRVGIAMSMVNELERPAEVSRTRWLTIEKVLITLCIFLPDPYPNQDQIVERSGLTLRTVRRALKTAESLGLIERHWREHGRWDSHGYTLNFLPETLFTSGHFGRSRSAKVTGQSTSPHGEASKPAPSVSSNEDTSAAPAAAAFMGQEEWPRKPDDCGACGAYMPASELVCGPGKRGWRCRDQVACKGRQKAAALEREQDLERSRQQEQAKRDYEASPEGIAAAAATAAWRKANPSPAEKEAQRKRERLAEEKRYHDSITMACGCRRQYVHHDPRCPDHPGEPNAEFVESKRHG